MYTHSHRVPIEIPKCSEIAFKQTITVIMAQMQVSHSGLYTSEEQNAIRSICKTNSCYKYAEPIKLQSSTFPPVLQPARSL